MLKNILLIGLVTTSLSLSAMEFGPNLSASQIDQISQAIYRTEGGKNTPYPFGVKSIDTHGNFSRARHICVQSIKMNFRRWNQSGRKIDFISFMAARWCPESADSIGHRNWIANMRKILNRK